MSVPGELPLLLLYSLAVPSYSSLKKSALRVIDSSGVFLLFHLVCSYYITSRNSRAVRDVLYRNATLHPVIAADAFEIWENAHASKPRRPDGDVVVVTGAMTADGVLPRGKVYNCHRGILAQRKKIILSFYRCS